MADAKVSVAAVAFDDPLPARFPNIRLETVRGTGHHLFLTHTRRCLELLTGFLREGDAIGMRAVDPEHLAKRSTQEPPVEIATPGA